MGVLMGGTHNTSYPPQNVVGEPGKGFIYAMNAFDKTRPAVSCIHLLLENYSRVRMVKGLLISWHYDHN